MIRAKQPVRNRQRKQSAAAGYYCRDCAHMYDPHSRALDGHLILCRCPFDEKSEHGKWCKFLGDPACEEHFKLRQDKKQ